MCDFPNLNIDELEERWDDLESAIAFFAPKTELDESTLELEILRICNAACWPHLDWRSVEVRNKLESFEIALRQTKESYVEIHEGIRQYFMEINLINRVHFEKRLQVMIDECARIRESLQEALNTSPERRRPQFKKNYLATELLRLFEKWRPGEATKAIDGEFRELVERVYHFLSGERGDFTRAVDHAFEQKDKEKNRPHSGAFPELLYWPEEFR